MEGDVNGKPVKHNTQVDFLGRRRLYFSGIILCIFDWPGDVFYRNIDEEIHVKPSAQKMICRLFACRQLKGLKRHLRKRPSSPPLITSLAKSFTIPVSSYINSAMQRRKQNQSDSEPIDY